MKKVLCLALFLSVCLTACGQKPAEAGNTGNKAGDSTPAAEVKSMAAYEDKGLVFSLAAQGDMRTWQFGAYAMTLPEYLGIKAKTKGGVVFEDPKSGTYISVSVQKTAIPEGTDAQAKFKDYLDSFVKSTQAKVLADEATEFEGHPARKSRCEVSKKTSGELIATFYSLDWDGDEVILICGSPKKDHEAFAPIFDNFIKSLKKG